MGVPGIGRLGEDRQVERLQRGLVAGQHRAAERVVLIDDAEAAGAQILDHVGHQPPNFLGVHGPYVHHVRIPAGVAQEIGPGEVADERYLRAAQRGGDASRRRGADAADDGEHLAGGGEPVRIGGGELRLVAVVARHELQLPAVDATPAVALVESGQNAGAVLETRCRAGAGEATALAESDGVPGHTRHRRRGDGAASGPHGRDEGEHRGTATPQRHLSSLPCALPSSSCRSTLRSRSRPPRPDR